METQMFTVTVRFTGEVDVEVAATDEREAARLAHRFVAERAYPAVWDEECVVAHLLGDSPVAWAGNGEIMLGLEPEDYEVTEVQ